MPLYKQKIDLYWTGEGDLILGENGDLLDTKNYEYRGFIQQVQNRIISSRGDWPVHPDVGAGVSDFLGRRNNRETAEEIKLRIIGELAREGLVAPANMKVDVIPVSEKAIIILVMVVPPGSRKAVMLNFSYNMVENKLACRNA